jgi:hypothetical protein
MSDFDLNLALDLSLISYQEEIEKKQDEVLARVEQEELASDDIFDDFLRIAIENLLTDSIVHPRSPVQQAIRPPVQQAIRPPAGNLAAIAAATRVENYNKKWKR